MSEWAIRKRAACCESCEGAFGEGEAHFSVLVLGEELARRDLCGRCFERGGQGGGAGGEEPVFWWRTRLPAEGRKRLAVDFEAVDGLFRALLGREEEHLSELRYLLALLLLRKRRLKLVRSERREGVEVFLLRRPRRDDEIAVPVHDLRPERALELRGELERIFEGGLDLPAVGTSPHGPRPDGGEPTGSSDSPPPA